MEVSVETKKENNGREKKKNRTGQEVADQASGEKNLSLFIYSMQCQLI